MLGARKVSCVIAPIAELTVRVETLSAAVLIGDSN